MDGWTVATVHNPSVTCRSELTLSVVHRSSRNARRCGHPIAVTARRDAEYCSPACRQSAYRARRDGRRFLPSRTAGPVPRLRVVSPETGDDLGVEVLDAPPSDAGRTSAGAQPVDRASTGPAIAEAEHVCRSRLCVECVVRRHTELRRAPGARVNAAAVAETIASTPYGDVWRAKREHGISYEHALRIRRGWRGGGRVARSLHYRSRGYYGNPTYGSHKVGYPRLRLRDLYPGVEVLDGLLEDAQLDAIAADELAG